MQLPPADEIVMLAGIPPIRAKKARYYEDPRFQERILPPPALTKPERPKPDDWSTLPQPAKPDLMDDRAVPADQEDEDTTGSERRRQPELERAAPVEKKAPIDNEFEPDLDDDTQDDAARASRMRDMMQGVARQVSLDPGDDMNL
jgi:type IV secretion system protein VirD4